MVDAKKSLYRMPKKGKILGVCAGLAEYFDMDVTLLRVIFVVLAFATGGAVVLLYFILAIILPTSDEKNGSVDEKIERIGQDLTDSKVVNRARNYIGGGLIVLGIWLLLAQFFPQLFEFRWDYVWPVVLILVGLIIVIRRGYDK